MELTSESVDDFVKSYSVSIQRKATKPRSKGPSLSNLKGKVKIPGIEFVLLSLVSLNSGQ